MLETRSTPAARATSAATHTARTAGRDEHATQQVLARLGSVAALVGAAVLFGSTLLHPLGSDPSDAAAAFAEYALDSLWLWSHIGQFAGIAALVVALVALASTLDPGPSAAWSRIGLAGAAATLAVAAAVQAVDGVALKLMVDRWAASTGAAQVLAYEGAFAVRQIEIGLASFLSLVSGLTLTAFGLAMFLSRRYPGWLGALGLLGGLGTVVAGTAQASTGFSGVAMTLSMLASTVLLLWAILTGVLLWRSAPRLANDG